MVKRDVDSDVLRQLADKTDRGRRELEDCFNRVKSRVDGAPGGWERGRWQGIPSFMRMEFESLDRESRELRERAAKIDVAAAVNDLPDPLPLGAWKWLLGLFAAPAFLPVFLTAEAIDGLVAKVAAFSKEFAEKNGRSPAVGDFGAFGARVIGGLAGTAAAARLGLTDMTAPNAGGSAQLRRVQRPSGNGGAAADLKRFSGQVVVDGRKLTDAEIAARAGAIRQAYQDVMGREPTDAEFDQAMRSGKPAKELLANTSSTGAATVAALKLAASPDYAKEVLDVYKGNANPYPDGIGATTVDCVTFAGAVYLLMGLPGTAIPGRGGGLVNSDPDSWSEGWVEQEEPSPGSYVRVGGSHSLVYLGSLGESFVVAESNYPTGSGPRIVVIDKNGKVTGDWTPAMGQPTDGNGSEAAAAIDRRYSGSPVFAQYARAL